MVACLALQVGIYDSTGIIWFADVDLGGCCRWCQRDGLTW